MMMVLTKWILNPCFTLKTTDELLAKRVCETVRPSQCLELPVPLWEHPRPDADTDSGWKGRVWKCKSSRSQPLVSTVNAAAKSKSRVMWLISYY